MNRCNSLASWQALESQAQTMSHCHLKNLFAEDPQRFNRYSVQMDGLLLDYSKNHINEAVLQSLLRLAEECELPAWRSAMFNGEAINRTENRSVLHVALRSDSCEPLIINGEDIRPRIAKEMAHIEFFSEQLRSGQCVGFSGQAIKDVVCIGVGGSNLGPQMVTEALASYSDERIKLHYVSNVDGTQIAGVLKSLAPETTLFILSSKTFTTSETMINGNTARQWLSQACDDDSLLARHFVAVTANVEAAAAKGIPQDYIFRLWDWVGGRFSLWSAIGLPIALGLGFSAFRELLEGACSMDKHFCEAPMESNIPVLMALVGVWNSTFMGADTQAILPYDQALSQLPDYLQQAEMESNGKSVNWYGESIPYQTGPVIWGQTGINGQHAFYQLLHQGKTVVPADFIGSVHSLHSLEGHHDHLMANLFAQTEALMNGVNEQQVREDLTLKGLSAHQIDDLVAHKVHQGNRPSNTLLLNKITAHSLGSLIALYEHKIFAQGVIWQLHSFDQWGVELGKALAKSIEPELADGAKIGSHDCSTSHLINYYKQQKSYQQQVRQ